MSINSIVIRVHLAMDGARLAKLVDPTPELVFTTCRVRTAPVSRVFPSTDILKQIVFCNDGQTGRA